MIKADASNCKKIYPQLVETPRERRTFRILALDGGGVRGIATASYLARIENRIDGPIYSYFDLITGTSTGGIIAIGLGLGIPAKKITALYRQRGKQVFTRRYSFLPKGFVRFIGSLYKTRPLCHELQRVYGSETVLGDAHTRLCIPAVNVTTGDATVFKTRHHDAFERDHRLPAWQIAAATAAAPIYFDPFHIPGTGAFADGGLWSNNPAEVGIVEACYLGYSFEEIKVLSVGTGTTPFGKKVRPGRGLKRLFHHLRFGVVGWREQLVTLVMRAQSQRASNISTYMLPERNYRRIQFHLPGGDFGLDAVDKTDALCERAVEKAKRTGREVRDRFFTGKVPPFQAVA